jgi:hypothetical protein
MNNVISMSADFERQKNIQASAMTAMVMGLVLLMIFLVTWSTPPKVEPPPQEYVEINLGNGDVGSGKDQPLLPGDPAPAQQTAYTPPQAAPAQEEAVKDASTDETDHAAPAVIKPNVSRPDATKINTESKTVKSTVTTPTPAPVIAPPKPKATLGHTIGGNGNGGNGADTYRPGTGEGVAGGQGDQGRPGGNPNGTSYTGTPRSFGVKEFSIPNQSFEDDFNQNAKIAMEIVTNGDGKVISASYTSRGSTGTASSSMIAIARNRAFQLKGIGPDMKGTVLFNFKVR